jgi:hypothetical protein
VLTRNRGILGRMHETTEGRPITNLPRRVPGGSGSFGGVAFQFLRAIRRVDETVLVEVAAASHPSEPSALVRLFEAVSRHGVAQLSLGNTICRAKPTAWEPEARAIVFELHRGMGQSPAPPGGAPSSTSHAEAAP